MEERRFNPQLLEKLNNPERLKALAPDFIWERLNISTLQTMIDIGAGTGFYSIPFVNYYKESKLYACDLSDIMINWMEENVCPKYDNIIPVKMEEYSIPLQNNIADLVFMINLHHELKSPEKMLTDCYRLLKTGGKIAIADWKKEEMPDGPPIQIRYQTEEVKKHLLDTGFNNIEIYNELSMHYLIIAEK